jgi:hypothetical protein
MKANVIELTTTTNSVVLVRKRTIPTDRPPLVGEVSVNVCEYRSRGQRGGSTTAVFSIF